MGKLWFIRHGLTILNEVGRQYREEGKDWENASERWDMTLCDAPLSETGVNQIRELIERVHELDIDIVVVSPLRRALQTCRILFSHHPKHPKVIVHPQAHEMLTTVLDISVYEGSPYEDYCDFDWSLMPSDGRHLAWHVSSNPYSASLKDLDYAAGRERIAQVMKELVPRSFENDIEMYHRAKEAMKIWKTLAIVGNVAVVGHSNLFRKTLASLNENNDVVESIYIDAAEIHEVF